MDKSKNNPSPAKLEDAIMAAKAAKSAKKAQQKKDQAASGDGGKGNKGFKPQIGGPLGQHAHTKANMPRMHSQQKKGGG